jgi:hypothetical protein
MTKEQQIDWLERFIEIWDRVTCRYHGHSERIDGLVRIYTKFCNTNGLPHESADDLLCLLKWDDE